MRTFMICTMAVALLAPQACVGDSPAGGGGDGDGGDTVTLPDGGSGTPDALRGGGEAGRLTLASPGLDVVRGKSGDVTVSLSWIGPPVGVTLAWAGLPPNVDGGTPRIIAEDVTTQSMTLSVPASVPFGEATVQLVATSAAPGFEQVVIDVPLLVRGNPGELDTSFGEDGNVQLPPAKYGAISMMADSQSRLVVTGQSEERATGNGISDGLVLARYLPNGLLDQGFATQGVAKWNPIYQGAAATSANYQLPLSTVEQGAGYRTAFPYSGFPTKVGVIDVGVDGSAIQTPAAPATFQAFFGSAIPEGDGAILWGSDMRSLRKMDASGAEDGAFAANAQLAPEPPGNYTSMYVTLLAASPTRIVVYVSASKGTVETQWLGAAVLDRREGTIIGRVKTTEILVAATASGADDFVAVGQSGATVWINGAGTGSPAPSVISVPEHAEVSALPLSLGNVGVIVTQQPGHATALHTLSTTGALVGTPTVLDSVDITDKGVFDARRVYAYQAYEDGRRRLVVFHRAPFNYVASSPLANPYWVIRRYWL